MCRGRCGGCCCCCSKAGCCCFGGFLCGFMLALLVLLSVVSVVFGLLALPLATWVQAHHEVLEGFLNCTIAEVKLANETVEAELPLECRELAWDDCQGCDGDEDGGDPKLDKECRYCGCQVVYVLESIKPSVKGALDKCCQTFKEDDGTKFLLSPCHDIVDNFTGSFAEGAKECKKKGIHSDVQKPVMLLSSASATMDGMGYGAVKGSQAPANDRSHVGKLASLWHAFHSFCVSSRGMRVLLASEAERATTSGSTAQDALAKAEAEIADLQERMARSRGEAEVAHKNAAVARTQEAKSSESADQLREACARFAETVRNSTQKWLSSLPESLAPLPGNASQGREAPEEMPPPAAPAVPAASVNRAVPAPEGPGTNDEVVVDSAPSQAADTQSPPSNEEPPLPPPAEPPGDRISEGRPPERLWSVA
ncbi:unnamed protein product, partial [Symbiodinium pilosum]